MANRQVALIRGINVGRAKRVAMADLRALVTELGYRDVSTLLNSGNVIFTVPRAGRGDPAARIERAMSGRLGVTARVLVLTAAEVAAIIAGNPLGKVAADPTRLLVTVLANPADRARLVPLTRQDWTPEALGLGPERLGSEVAVRAGQHEQAARRQADGVEDVARLGLLR